MLKKFSKLFAVLGAVATFYATGALAQPAQITVEATQATAVQGQSDVSVRLTLSSTDIDLGQLLAYTFNFMYDADRLSFSHITMGISPVPLLGSSDSSYLSYVVPVAGPYANTEVASFAWLDESSSGGAIADSFFDVFFDIKADALPGTTTITFDGSAGPSDVTDFLFNTAQYSDVTDSSTPMQITITPVAAVPEPAELSMLLAGLGLVGVVIRRRRARQAPTGKDLL